MNIDINEHYDKIYRYCYFKLKNQHIAEDITQETFLRFMESKHYKDVVIEKENLRQAMETLTNEEQELLLLRYVNEISFSDLSKLYKKSRFALYRELSKITKKLERRLSDGS